jgi:hypothetical protein
MHFYFSTKLFQKYKNIFTSLHIQPKPKNIITASYLLSCIIIYFTVLHIIFTFTYIHTLCLTTTRWSWGHKNEELFCRLLEEERQELFRLFSESSILTLSFPREENLLLLQHSVLGVPTWNTCLVSSRLFSRAVAEEQRKVFRTASFIEWRKFSDAQSSSRAR